MPQRERLCRFAVAILVDLVVGVASGFFGQLYFWGWSHWLVYVSLEIAGVSTTVAVLITSDVRFGSPDMGPGGACFTVLSSALLALWCSAFLLGLVTIAPIEDNLAELAGWVMVAFSSFPVYLIGLRGMPARAMALACVGIVAFRSGMGLFGSSEWMFADGVHLSVCCKAAVAMLLSSHTKYLRDQRLVYVVCFQPAWAFAVGAAAAKTYTDEPSSFTAVRMTLYLIMTVSLAEMNLAMRRRKRYLPPGLSKAKFVRLGYLRQMVAEGRGIERCQDLPADAFGDPTRSRYLVVVSHRWFDPLTCDAFSTERPRGTKLDELVTRLEDRISHGKSASGCGSRLQSWMWSCCTGGWDVLVFLDYMCIPQRGVGPGGVIVNRTLEEEKVFQECLPNMGALYSVFPLVVLDSPATNDVPRYDESGWCFCEFTVASMCNQLQMFPSSSMERHQSLPVVRLARGKLDADGACLMDASMCEELEKRRFEYASDRDVAKGIFRSFLAKRLLVDAIQQGDHALFKNVLRRLTDHGLRVTLDLPTDEHLNTLVHLAVRCNFAQAVPDLLNYGAAPDLRNLVGDRPWEWFGLPRLCNPAASICRRWAKGSFARSASGTARSSGTVNDFSLEVMSV